MRTKPREDARTAVYLRVSTGAQTDDSQAHEAAKYLKAHGIADAAHYRDTASGATLERPAFERLQKDILAGRVHTVVVWRLDRLSRSLRDGIVVLTDWLGMGVRVISLTQDLDFAGATGKLVASVLLAVGEMEREGIRERTRAGLAAARAKGTRLGRPPGSSSKWSLAKRKIDPALAASLRAQGVSVNEIAAKFGCTRQTVYSALREGTERKGS